MLLEEFDKLPLNLIFDTVRLEEVRLISEIQIRKLAQLVKPLGSVFISGYCSDAASKTLLNASKLVFLLKLAGFSDVTVSKGTDSSADGGEQPDQIRTFSLSATRNTQTQTQIQPSATVQNYKRVANNTKTIDCEVGNGSSSRKACKNCTCGLASSSGSEIQPVKLVVSEDGELDTAQYESKCGSCGLGDEFRCAGCPFSGLPKFKPGEIIRLSVDKADI